MRKYDSEGQERQIDTAMGVIGTIALASVVVLMVVLWVLL
jgi:hypothetical protein